MAIGLSMIVAGVLPIPIVYLLRRFQILKVDLDIHQGSIRRNETTASTKQMMDDDDVSTWHAILFIQTVNAFDSENHLVLIVKCSILKCVNKIDNKSHISFLVFNAC